MLKFFYILNVIFFIPLSISLDAGLGDLYPEKESAKKPAERPRVAIHLQSPQLIPPPAVTEKPASNSVPTTIAPQMARDGSILVRHVPPLRSEPHRISMLDHITPAILSSMAVLFNRSTTSLPLGRSIELLTPLITTDIGQLPVRPLNFILTAALMCAVDSLDFYNPCAGSYTHFGKLTLSSTLLFFGCCYIFSKSPDLREKIETLFFVRQAIIAVAVAGALLGYYS